MHQLYSVNADVDTGHWLDSPEFDKAPDTPDATFTKRCHGEVLLELANA